MVTLLLNSIAHFLVDALCVTTLFSAAEAGERLLVGVVLYNTLAFSTQCVVGLLVDRLKREKTWELASFVLVILGFALPLPFYARIVLVGLGNSVFHVAAGTVTLRRSGEAAWPLGIFVAPGAFGVTLGTLFPRFGWLLAGLMVLCAAAIALTQQEPVAPAPPPPPDYRFPLLPIVLLTLAVAVRALGGVAVSFPWKQTALHAFLLTGFVFLGKAAGGFICDRLGAVKTAWLTVPLAAILIAFFSSSMPLSLLGQLLLNLTMPVTLWLLYQITPDAPCFAFGLAASALWPGTIAGQMVSLSGPHLWLLVIPTFLFGLFAIVYSANRHQTDLIWRECT